MPLNVSDALPANCQASKALGDRDRLCQAWHIKIAERHLAKVSSVCLDQ